ncbi:MAG: metalloendopeptidase [Bacteroidetes bacterium RIFCSPLOWO2_12_FULL_31_6]|nr:MAG: metalloendopeptidase [Bacteroidetes bacterium RIFCSPLOWO2_12_FULL_31_6]
MKNFNYCSLALISFLIFACTNNSEKKEAVVAVDPLIEHIDSTFKASTDFFMFANNGWFKQHPIKASDRDNGIFKTIGDTINAAIQQICVASSKSNAAKGSNSQKIGDFYKSGMDTITLEKLGISPLQEELNKIDNVKSSAELIKEIAHLHQIGASPLFSFYISSDDKNSSQYACFLWQGGLGLGQRDYYFNQDERTVNIRKEYVKHIQKMFQLLKLDEKSAAATASSILKIETDLAQVSKKLEDLRDPYENYNKVAFSDLNKKYPAILWQNLFQEWQLNNVDSLVIGQPKFYEALGATLNKYDIEQWKNYCKWNLISAYASYLSKDFVDEDFHFFKTVLSGVKEQKPRWEIVVNETNDALGELIGQIYVKDYLPENTKEKLLEIGENIRTVYGKHIKALDWMSEATKVKALSKLAKINMKVGYPNQWKDMSKVEINTNYLENMLHVSEWEFNRMIAKYGKPVDRNEWEMFPQTYNAYYSATFNEIVVPACNIIVPGYEGKMPDDAILYGIIGGSTFGHEITHGFDDEGSQYDETGNLNNWWTKEDREKFKAKTKLIVEQYSQYTVLDSLHINGDATQGENIADLGGVTIGFEAFKNTELYKTNKIIGGLSPSQRFFMSYAFAWMVQRRDEAMAHQIMTDVHSPAKFRVNGVVSNFAPFYEAFNVKEGDAMYRTESVQVKIW